MQCSAVQHTPRRLRAADANGGRSARTRQRRYFQERRQHQERGLLGGPLSTALVQVRRVTEVVALSRFIGRRLANLACSQRREMMTAGCDDGDEPCRCQCQAEAEAGSPDVVLLISAPTHRTATSSSSAAPTIRGKNRTPSSSHQPHRSTPPRQSLLRSARRGHGRRSEMPRLRLSDAF